jgi:hypothetical protein
MPTWYLLIMAARIGAYLDKNRAKKEVNAWIDESARVLIDAGTHLRKRDTYLFRVADRRNQTPGVDPHDVAEHGRIFREMAEMLSGADDMIARASVVSDELVLKVENAKRFLRTRVSDFDREDKRKKTVLGVGSCMVCKMMPPMAFSNDRGVCLACAQ